MSYYEEENGELGAIDVRKATRVFAPPFESVINGVTYRTEEGKVYRKQNGRLIPITNPQELADLERQYVPPPRMRLQSVTGYENKPDTESGQDNSGLMIAAIVGIALFFLLRK